MRQQVCVRYSWKKHRKLIIRGGKTGIIEAADGGTLFLDEIGEMPVDMQVTLLRILQDHIVVRLGAHTGKKVNVRIITATNKQLLKEVQDGNFREDLYYRLNVFRFAIPPLRQRKTDIPLLISHIMKDLCEKHKASAPIIESEAMDALINYDWPGNIRELQNIIEVLLFSCRDNKITLEQLPKELLMSQAASDMAANPKIKAYEMEVMQKVIMTELHKYNGNMTKTAKALGISRKTLYNKINSFGHFVPLK